jgi:hypothetical protein
MIRLRKWHKVIIVAVVTLAAMVGMCYGITLVVQEELSQVLLGMLVGWLTWASGTLAYVLWTEND